MRRIRQLRKERELSQVKLAVMADMDPATLNRLEQGKGNPNLKTIERVADALGVEVADLLPKTQSPLFPSDPTPRRLAAALPGDWQKPFDLTGAAAAVPDDAIAQAQEEAADAAQGLSELDPDELAAVVGRREAEYRATRDTGGEGAELAAVRGRYVRALAALVEQRAVGDKVELVLRQALGRALVVAEGAGDWDRA
ncbi:MAG TPA: helix-turn-helix transcriptional regulator [Rubrobacter sp.]|nr:helix-turn-helix transcriptional regulator [Rubrobacter sp.]